MTTPPILPVDALVLLDYVGIAVFAISGALLAAEKKQTLVTFIFFAGVTGVGGGTVRDLLIGAPVFWVQEEPRNAGPWYFMSANLLAHIGSRLPLSVVSRPAAASPATGSHASHKLEQERLLTEAFAR